MVVGNVMAMRWQMSTFINVGVLAHAYLIDIGTSTCAATSNVHADGQTVDHATHVHGPGAQQLWGGFAVGSRQGVTEKDLQLMVRAPYCMNWL